MMIVEIVLIQVCGYIKNMVEIFIYYLIYIQYIVSGIIVSFVWSGDINRMCRMILFMEIWKKSIKMIYYFWKISVIVKQMI